jgi:hypothetical protein
VHNALRHALTVELSELFDQVVVGQDDGTVGTN